MTTLMEGMVVHLMGDTGVTGIIGTRLYPMVVPQDAELPAAAYQQLSGPREHSHSGASGLVRARVQFTCMGASYNAAKDVAEALRLSLDGFKGSMGNVDVQAVFLDNEVDGYASTFEAAVTRVDFVVWYGEER